MGVGFYSMMEPGRLQILAVPSRVSPNNGYLICNRCIRFLKAGSIDEPEDTEVQVPREQRGGQLVCDGIFLKNEMKRALGDEAAGHRGT